MASVMHSSELQQDGDDSIKEVQPESSLKQEKREPKKRKVMESNEMQGDSYDPMKEVQPESSSKQQKREPKKRKPKSEVWEDIDPVTGRKSAFWDNFFFLKRGPVNEEQRQKAMKYNIEYRWNHEKNCLSFKKIKVPKKYRKKIFNMASLKKKLKKEKKEREKKVDKIFQLLPSINGIKATDGYKIKIPKTLDQLTDEAVAMKKHLEAHMNVQGSEFLLKSVEYVIHMVALFSSRIVLPTFDWNTRRYPKECPKIAPMDVKETCKLAKNQLELSKRGLVFPKLWCQPVDFSFNGMEKKIWLEFKEFDKGNSEEVKRSIQLDHPIVSVIGDFAVAVFNEACEINVKKDVHNNLHHFEYIECQYLKLYNTYYFHMIIEAIEEGNLGVYETEVMCSSDGSLRRLVKFLLTDRKPVGTRAMAVSLFSSLRSVCKTVKGVAEEKLSELQQVLNVLKVGMERGRAMGKLHCISQLRTEIIEDLHRLLFREHPLLFSPDCSRTTYPDAWSHPDNNFYSVMVRRTKGTPCRGYDYLTSCSHG